MAQDKESKALFVVIASGIKQLVELQKKKQDVDQIEIIEADL
jgi:hypothetical protein